ncbi:MAG TPA: transcriptional coactivator p15/PC4 family protein [Candidatus Deferrimicrobium sp.]|nr:transcriptional coactivator p15/PC4 family protein [Candidatus Deferrimicrobium sp.]
MRFELERSPTEKLVIENSEFKGHDLVSLRIYFLSGEDEWLPTKKGVTFRREQLDEVLEALAKIKAGKR